MPTHILSRHDTAAHWTASNPVLQLGELGVETDTKNLKVGDGVTAWTALSYALSGAFVAIDAQRINARDHGVRAIGEADVDATGVTNRVAINNLIATVPKGTVIYFPQAPILVAGNTTTYPIDAPIEVTREVRLEGSHPRRVRFQCAAGFTGNQMIRNWVASDYAGGEVDHTVAPLVTASPCFYAHLKNIRLDVNGKSNVTCLGWVHLQESSVIDGLIMENTPNTGSGNLGFALFTNNDSGGNNAGEYVIRNLVQYQGGWISMIRVDSTAVPSSTGWTRNLVIRDFTTAPNTSLSGGDNYSDSPLYFRGVDGLYLSAFECEGLPPDSATDAAQIRCIDVSGIHIGEGARTPVGGNVTARPALRCTKTGTPNNTQYPMGSPLITGLDLYKTSAPAGNYTGNIIEDHMGGVARDFARDTTLFDPAYIHYYDGGQIAWNPVGATAAIVRRTLVDSVRDAHRPAGVIRDTFDRKLISSSSGALLTSGTLLLVTLDLEVGDIVTSLLFTAGGTAAVTPTHQWAALFSPTRAKLAISADDTTAAWGTTLDKTFTMTAPYTVTVAGTYYAGLLVTAATVPSLLAVLANATLLGRAPILVGIADTGLTDPTTCPATAAAISASVGGTPYVQVK